MKKLLSLLLSTAMVLSMAACSPSASSPSPSAPDNTVTPSHYPVTVTDQAGREVTIEEEPQRLVSGYYISTSALIALDLADRMVGIEAKAAKRAIYQLAAPALIDLPSVGSAKEFDLEGCAALEPDLVILPLKLKSAAETLESLGIDVLLVNPENQALLEEMIRLIAAAANREDTAQSLLDFTAEQETMLGDALSGEATPSVYLAGNSSLLSTAGEAMYQSDLIRLAGGVNAAAEITDTYWVEIDYEQLLAWDPDYIILASDANYTVEDVLTDPNLAGCTAVENGQVYQIPGKAEAWDSPVPGGILGAVWMANMIHGRDVCPDYETVADEYYESFYDFTYTAD